MSFKELLHKLKKKQLSKSDWLIVALAGVLILIILLPVNGENKNADKNTDGKQSKNAQETVGEEENTAGGQSSTSLELQLEKILSKVEGVGNVSVMITYKDSGTQVLEKDSNTSSNTSEESDSTGGSRITKESGKQETTVFDETGDGSTPFVAKELNPEIEGVLIVAEGGDQMAVKQNISEAVLALFPVEAHRIKIVKMN